MKLKDFPLYPEKLLSSPTLSAMDTCEFGSYCRLLFTSFIQDNPCYIKNDDRFLMKITGNSKEQWEKIKPVVLKEFTEENGYLYNEVLLAIYKKECKSKKITGKNQLTLLTATLNYTFAAWWKDYDKKVGSAERLIPKWMKLTDKDREDIRVHTALYKKAQPDKAFRKNPETYLNQRAWEHELIIYNKSKERQDNGDTTRQGTEEI